MDPKKILHNTTFSVQLPYIAGHSVYGISVKTRTHIFIKNLILTLCGFYIFLYNLVSKYLNLP